MSANEQSRFVTAEEFEQLESELHIELIAGRLRPALLARGEQNGVVTMMLTAYATVYALEHTMGRCYVAGSRFILSRDPYSTLTPDWAFTRRERLTEDVQPGFATMIPDIVLEVRSASDSEPDMQDKIMRWLNAGVRLVWELNTRARILTIYQDGAEPQTLGLNDTLTGGDLLPGFSFDLRGLFATQ